MASMTPAISVVAAIRSVAKCARTMASDCRAVSGSTMSRFHPRSSAAEPLANLVDLTAEPTGSTSALHYHMTSC
jgi:hypothetical protein